MPDSLPPSSIASPSSMKLSRGRRPSPPDRQSSFSKRHASIDSPREIPLPSPSLHVSGGQVEYSYFDVQKPKSPRKQKEFEVSECSSADLPQPSLSLEKSASPLHLYETHSPMALLPPSSKPIHPFPRPYSLPHSSSSGSESEVTDGVVDFQTSIDREVDRNSSASLPLPTQIPFHTLPKTNEPHRMNMGRLRELVSQVARSEVPESSAEEENSPSNPPPFRSPLSRTANNPNIPNNPSSIHQLAESTVHATALRSRPPSIRSNNPPDPPTILPTPGPPFLLPPEPSLIITAAMAVEPSTPATINPSELPPVLPPSRTKNVNTDRLSNASTSGSGSGSSGSSTLSNADSSSSSGPGVSRSASASGTGSGSTNPYAPPPYAPFLSPMPPPADSWIEVETSTREYRLNIRLPGFKRDGITLATKRRRILHIVADSWPDPDPSPRRANHDPDPTSDPSTPLSTSTSTTSTSTPNPHRGGHFERRISFGYDADLVGVRAEFDGEMLKIVVPRRQDLTMGAGTGMGVGSGFGGGGSGFV